MPRFLRSALPSSVALAFILAALVAMALTACNNDDGQKSVTGQVIDVVDSTIVEFESLTVQDDDGVVWEFKGGLFAGFTPSHLREHMAFRQPVRVWYEEVDGELRVTKIEDE